MMPSVVVTVEAAGERTPDVQLSIDGKRYPNDSTPIEIDPGGHKISVSARGFKDEARVVSVGTREKRRPVKIVLTSVELTPKAAVPSTTREQPASATAPVPTASWIAFAAGAVGLAVGVVFTAAAIAEKAKCTETACTGTTPNENKAALKTSTIGLAAGYGTAILGGGIGLAIWFESPRTDPTPTTAFARTTPSINGAGVGVAARF
jgi:hypothetical protein